MRPTFACVVLMSLVSSGSQQGRVQDLPKCVDARVEYTPFDEEYSSRIQLSPSPKFDKAFVGTEKTFTNQHTRWLARVPPDNSKPGPWTDRLYVGRTGSGPDLELIFVDEGSGGVSAQWLNEKLIFGEVWWGRIGATDFILDVEQNKFVYREMAHFGELIQPCR